MSNSIVQEINDLPKRGVTVYVLNSLDFLVPKKWENFTDWETMVQSVTRESDPALIASITKRAEELYADRGERYQRAMGLYRTVDRTDKALATAALADKVGERIRFLSFLQRLTPKADRAQTIDFSLKLVVELLAFCAVNGIPGDSVKDFVRALNAYEDDALMRMAALVTLDGVIPLGPDVARLALDALDKTSPNELAENQTYRSIRDEVPGGSDSERLRFIQESLGETRGWISGFIDKHNLTAEKALDNVRRYVDISDDRMDYLGAFFDMTTDYYTHTGTQSVARSLIERSVNEI